MSADISRRGFLVSLFAAAVVPPAAIALPKSYTVDDVADSVVDMIRSMARRGSFASFILPPFRDLEVDRYYVLQGGPYEDTGGWGCPYAAMGDMLVETLREWDAGGLLDDRLARLEREGFYLTPSQYFGKPWRQYDRIYLTERWMREFYRRHGDDASADWGRRYDEYRDALLATGWKPEYDRMSREELVAIGWKGVDIYRKEG